MNRWYSDVASSEGIATRGYYEGEPIRPVGLVVPLDAADPHIAKVTPIPLPFDHWKTAKPSSRTSQLYMGVVQFIEELCAEPSLEETSKSLRLLIVSPPGGKCSLPAARAKVSDMKLALDEALAASGVPPREWLEKALDDYTERANGAVKVNPHAGFIAHHGVEVTLQEEYALDVGEWIKHTGMNLLFSHERQTFGARSITFDLQVTNGGDLPAERRNSRAIWHRG